MKAAHDILIEARMFPNRTSFRKADGTLIDVKQTQLPTVTAPNKPVRPTKEKVGTELSALLNNLGFKAQFGCSCKSKAALMDLNGADWCEQNINTIVDWLHENYKKEKLSKVIPFSRFAAKLLVKMAIKQARQNFQKLLDNPP